MYQWIKPVYYPGEEKLMSLEMLNLYPGEDVVRQEPPDVDPDRWIDEGELTELPKVSLGERVMETRQHPVNPEITAEPVLEILVIPEDPEEMAAREGIYERIQAEIYHENKEREAWAEEMLEIPPEWNEVPDFNMEVGVILPENMRPEKWRRD